MNNHISQNIKYLMESNDLTATEFSKLFALSSAVLSTYTTNRSKPKIEVIQQICKHFSITIDSFINKDLSFEEKAQNYPSMAEAMQMQANEESGIYGLGEVVEQLKDQLRDKEEIIKLLRDKLRQYESNTEKTA